MLKTKDAENMEKAYQKYKLDNVKSTSSFSKIDNVEVRFVFFINSHTQKNRDVTKCVVT